jgi:hypothetical protein
LAILLMFWFVRGQIPEYEHPANGVKRHAALPRIGRLWIVHFWIAHNRILSVQLSIPSAYRLQAASVIALLG